MPATTTWLILIFALIFLIVAFIIPKWGVWALIRIFQQRKQNEYLEDTLKYIFDRQQQGRMISLDALKAKLNLPTRVVYQLIERMDERGLLEHRGDELNLTPSGEQLALQIIRAHRLWERYLADEARMPLKNVHKYAHRKEHGMSKAEIEALDASLGHPAADPHGDPIPGAEGKFRRVEKGVSLPLWKPDAPGKITHLEDEPPMAYAQIIAEGLQIGQTVHILDQDHQRITFTDGENEYKLAPAVAANIFLSPLKQNEISQKDLITLNDLSHRTTAEIISLDDRCQGFTRRRFLDLGLTPGTIISPELQNSFGDPRAYRVRGTLIALRKDQAADIWVRPVS